MNTFDDFTSDDFVKLVDYYNQFDKWKLIRRIIQLENRDTLSDIVAEYK